MTTAGRIRLFGFAAALLALAPAASRAAAESPWVESDYGAVRLIAAEEAVGTATELHLGAEFRMKPGWKIYWRSPGDAGFPPRFDWKGSDNLADAALRWPVPERFSAVGFETVGYEGSVVLPIDALVARPGQPLTARAHVEYLTCEEICVPLEADLSLSLPAGPAAPSGHAHRIAQFTSRVPGPGDAAGLAIDGLRLAGGKAPRLTVEASAEAPFSAPDVLVEGPRELVFSRPRVTLLDGGRRARLAVDIEGLAYLKSPLSGETVTVTLIDGPRAAERTLRVPPPSEPVEEGGGAAPGLVPVLGLALLGGLILNLMPCVLPVLAIKLLGVIGLGGRSRAQVRLGFLASAAGILAFFAVLAGSLIALKAAGAAIGWGIQFQQPWFLAAMIVVVTAFACNLWDLFAIPLPAWLGAAADSGPAHGLGGHFATGLFATLLATPCSAPFLGTAVGFALARGPAEIAAIFTAVGAGLAAPYLAVAAVPGLAARLPRPGPWMITLRRILGLALAGTALWLLRVLWIQAGPATAIAAGLGVAVLVLALSARRRLGGRYGSATNVLAAFGLAAVLAAPALPSPRGGAPVADGFWQPFDEAAIPGLVRAGKTVFVDVTAEWCITCQVNEKVAIGTEAVRARLADGRVVAMRADWTRPDPAVSRFLARYGRYGIPFNIVYGPAAPDGVALPELLTPGAVVDALAAAGKPS